MNIVTDVVSAVETLITQFSWRRTFIALFLVVIATSAILGAEWYTGYFQLGRLERATALLERLAVLDQKLEIRSSPALQATKDRLVSDLHLLVVPSAVGAKPVPSLANAQQFTAGALPWLLFSLFFVSDWRKGDELSSTIIGVTVLLGIIFGALAALMPNTWTSVPSLAALALGPVAIVVVLYLWRRVQKKGRAKAATVAAE